MKVYLLAACIFVSLAFIGEVRAERSLASSTDVKVSYYCEALKHESLGFKTAKNCKMKDGTIANVLFKADANVEIFLLKANYTTSN